MVCRRQPVRVTVRGASVLGWPYAGGTLLTAEAAKLNNTALGIMMCSAVTQAAGRVQLCCYGCTASLCTWCIVHKLPAEYCWFCSKTTAQQKHRAGKGSRSQATGQQSMPGAVTLMPEGAHGHGRPCMDVWSLGEPVSKEGSCNRPNKEGRWGASAHCYSWQLHISAQHLRSKTTAVDRLHAQCSPLHTSCDCRP